MPPYPEVDINPGRFAAINFLSSKRLTVHASVGDPTKVQFTWSESSVLDGCRYHDVDFDLARDFLTEALAVVEALREQAPKPRYVISVTDGDGDVWYQREDGLYVLKFSFDSDDVEAETLAYLKARYGIRDVDVVEIPAAV